MARISSPWAKRSGAQRRRRRVRIIFASWLFPCEAVQKFVEAVQLVLEVGEFGLLGAELRFGIDLVGLQALLIGGASFHGGFHLGKRVFHLFALSVILHTLYGVCRISE